MSRTPQELLSEALLLPIEERTALADSIYESLGSGGDDLAEIERAWLDEAQRRVGQLDRGESDLLSPKQVDGRMRALLGQ